MRKLLVCVLVLLSVYVRAQIRERSVVAETSLETKGVFIHQTKNVPVADITYVQWSVTGVGTPLTNPSAWSKVWNSGVKFISYSTNYGITWTPAIVDVNNKVTMITGWSLTQNNFTNEYKNKLDSLSSGAALITITGVAPIVSSGGNSPAISILPATQASAGSLSAADKTKLDNLTGNAADLQSDWEEADTTSANYIKHKPITPGETDPVIRAIDGIVKSNGTTATSATAGVDYLYPNAAISEGQHTKISYDAKGLVISGSDATTNDIAEADNLYYTEGRVSANVDVAANTLARHASVTIGTANGLSISGQELSMALASTSTTGTLTDVDWDIFNGKQDALGFTPYNATNPAGYIPLTSLSSSSAALTYNNSTGVFSITGGFNIPDTTSINNWNIAYDNYAAIDLNTKIDTSTRAKANGVATLDENVKVPLSQLPDVLLGAVHYVDSWNIVTDTPTLPSAVGHAGDYYGVNGSGVFEGITYNSGDWIISNGTAWGQVSNSNSVVSVFGRKGAVVANYSDYNTSLVPENGPMYYTDARARAAISLTTAPAPYPTYNQETGEFNIPASTGGGGGSSEGFLYEYEIVSDGQDILNLPFYLTDKTVVFFNGAILPAPAWSGVGYSVLTLLRPTRVGDYIHVFATGWGTIVSEGGGGGGTMVYPLTSGIVTYNGTNWGTSITNNSTNWNAAYAWGNWATHFGNTSGTITQGNDARLSDSRPINIAPGAVGNVLTSNGVSWTSAVPTNIGTVTSVSALTLGTTGTDVSSSVANGTTTPVITLNIPTASATNRGVLSSADWSAFNGKQAAGTYSTDIHSNITALNAVSGTNTGDNAVNSNYSGLVSFPGFGTTGSTATVGNDSRFITPGASGNLMVSTGTVWESSTPVSLGIVKWVSPPATKTSTGTAGQAAYDVNYLYICTATNTWKRVAIATNW